ncbi:sugar transferase [Bacillus salipaludis]|uniref:Sugar transferase n=1 Tax=Bacillus salipaludis TaxID=2547811 RepID=A0A4V3AUD0_9BACI|nr:sugar transferase [Bacillus salipaludis]TDK64129.1 sugar transferase [Bacillus salipaludis]
MEQIKKQTVVEISYKEDTSPGYIIGKRIIDIIGGVMGILLTLPILFIIMSFYLFGTNKGPIFFKQIRIGKNGKKFYIYKFRSMVVDAETRLRENNELYNKYVRNNFKLDPSEDPRITPFGRFIRKTSLDEIPQFINVIKGDMSLVGPRPVVEEELEEYKNKKEDFLKVKPGITGYWQVSGRSNVGYPERVDIELFYVYNKSLFLDIKILCATVIQVLKRKGAY